MQGFRRFWILRNPYDFSALYRVGVSARGKWWRRNNFIFRRKLKDSMRIQIPGLNGLRAIAIILVLFTHARFFEPPLCNPIFHKMPILFSGRLHYFFCYSGFLITKAAKLEEENKEPCFKNFYLRRLSAYCRFITHCCYFYFIRVAALYI